MNRQPLVKNKEKQNQQKDFFTQAVTNARPGELAHEETFLGARHITLASRPEGIDFLGRLSSGSCELRKIGMAEWPNPCVFPLVTLNFH
jgi:hypothetical protein